MRWILGIVLFLTSLGAISYEKSAVKVNKPASSTQFLSCEQATSLDKFGFDFSELLPDEARVRTSNPTQQRIKNERAVDLETVPGLEFLSCKLIRSYSEKYIDLYLKQILQKTIRGNAP